MAGQNDLRLWQLPKDLRQVGEEIERGEIRRMSDSVFKYVFCREERIHIYLDMINSFVFPGNEGKFRSVRFIDREFSPERAGGRGGRLDSLAIADCGDNVNLEVQAAMDPDFAERAVTYMSWVHGGQLARGRKYYEVARTISVNIMGYEIFPHFPDRRKFRSSFSLREDENGHRLSGNVSLIFYEMPKFAETVKIPRTKQEKWLAYFAGTGGKEMEQMLKQEPGISDALAAERFFMMDRETRLAYMQEWKHIIDDETREARAEARGETKGKYEMARNLLASGISPEIIAETSGLSVSEILSLMD